MNTQEESGSIWRESMRIGIPKFDDERKVMTMIIELLDMNKSHLINNEFFLVRFAVLLAAVEALFKHEELLMSQMQIPESIKEQHINDHDSILAVFNNVYLDSMDKKGTSAFEVYQMIRNLIKEHILSIASKLKEFVPTRTLPPY